MLLLFLKVAFLAYQIKYYENKFGHLLSFFKASVICLKYNQTIIPHFIFLMNQLNLEIVYNQYIL